MVVQHNMQAMNANRMLNVTTSTQAKSTEKLSSGYKINRAADDAAGLTISEKMRKQIKGLDQASTNAEDGVSAVQTAEGALTEVHSMLQRMNELAVQAANGTNAESDRQAIQDEVNQLNTEIDRVAETTKFNEIYLLKGDSEGGTKTEKLAAHDAGLAGTLVDNGDGTATFTAKALKHGEEVNIAGKSYTVDGVTSPNTNSITQGTAGADTPPTKGTYTFNLAGMQASLGGKATFTIDGKDYTIDVAKNDDAKEIGNKLAGALNNKIDDGLGSKYAVTNNNGTLTFTAGTEGANNKAITGAYKPVENGTPVTDIYNKMKDELATASSIGTDIAATVTNNNGTFTITKGSVSVADSLSFNLHVGADADMTNKINVNIETMNSAYLGIKNLNVTDKTGTAATYAIDAIADAVAKVSSQRSALGAVQNRLEHTIANVDNVVENTTSAESRIRDTDMAEEMVEYSKNNILAQAGQSMLAQANQSNQGVLSLLQ